MPEIADGAPATSLASRHAAVLPLVDGRLYAISLPYRVGPRTSTHPPGSTGYSSINCYLLREGERALLVDTGFPAQEPALLEALGWLVEPSTGLSVMAARPGECSSLGCLIAVTRHHRVDTVYSMLPRELLWAFDVRSRAAQAADPPERHLPASEILPMRAGPRSLSLGAGGTRRLEWFRPLLHLILQTWLYDEETRTLLTSEAFTHLWRDSPSGPWIVDDPAGDPTTVDELAAYLAGGDRFWWLPGADGGRLADWLEEIFRTRPVERIAPAFGCIIEGADLVRHEVDLLARALRALSREPSYAVAGRR